MATSRLFADDYASAGQLEWKEGKRGAGSAYWDDDYLGQLRFDSLLSRTLVVHHSQILDGVFFLGTGPFELKSHLGRVGLERHEAPALEIRGEGGSLEDSLASLLRRPGHDNLKARVFYSVSAELRHQLAGELQRTHETALERALGSAKDVPAGVAAVLKDCLHRIDPALDADEVVAPLETGWRRWLDEAADVEIRSHPTFTQFDLQAEIAHDKGIERNLRTSGGRVALERVLGVLGSGPGSGSDVSQILASARDDAAGDETRADLDLIGVWQSRLRYRALCGLHGCACALIDRPWLPAVGPAEAILREALRTDAGTQVPLPPDVLTTLGDLDAEQFREFVHRSRRVIVAWWESEELEGLTRWRTPCASSAAKGCDQGWASRRRSRHREQRRGRRSWEAREDRSALSSAPP